MLNAIGISPAVDPKSVVELIETQSCFLEDIVL